LSSGCDDSRRDNPYDKRASSLRRITHSRHQASRGATIQQGVTMLAYPAAQGITQLQILLRYRIFSRTINSYPHYASIFA
jgi:hypothetical protein